MLSYGGTWSSKFAWRVQTLLWVYECTNFGEGYAYSCCHLLNVHFRFLRREGSQWNSSSPGVKTILSVGPLKNEGYNAEEG